MKILVSACLLGCKCKYNGGDNYSSLVDQLQADHQLYPACPEELGGLSSPRPPAEIKDGKVVNKKGQSVDKNFRLGAQKTFELAKKEGIGLAILQARSPSCGVKEVYDGSFTGRLVAGQGITAQVLSDQGIELIESEDEEKIKGLLKKDQ